MRMMMIIFLMLFSPNSVSAEECDELYVVCVKDGYIYGNGIPYFETCIESTVVRSCDNPNAANNCEAIDADARCEEVSSECTYEHYGQCAVTGKNYSCFNGELEYEGAVLTDRTASNLTENWVGDCATLEGDTKCTQTETRCLAPNETRNVNGFEFARECWQQEKSYNCFTDDQTSTCGSLEAEPSCAIKSQACLVEEDGDCLHTEYIYACGEGGYTNTPECTSTEVCVGDLCATYEEDPSDDFGKATAWLNFLDELSNDGDIQETVFNGRGIYCRKKGFGYKDCCRGSGWGLDLYLGACRDNELELKAARESFRTVYVGSWCVESIFGYCINTRRMYCVFNSRLARLIQEGVREQLGRDFLPLKTPDCNGLTVEMLEAVDLEAIDLTEIVEDVGVENASDSAFIDAILEKLTL